MEEQELKIALRTVVENLLQMEHTVETASRDEKPAANLTRTIASDEPWIQTDLCTGCGECIMINSNIFTYNANKKAIVKNARGGPFRDLVRAAEKCAARIIHPGSPLDLKEKDLDRWIKRSERYNH
ncbi:MAG: ferredoxin [Spirochaetales bacterium]|nr:ferredoxin [Spirochaetales bacterium]